MKRRYVLGCFFCLLAPLVAACGTLHGSSGHGNLDVTESSFGTAPDGSEVTLFTLTNENGLKTQIIDYGARVHSLYVPDRSGRFADITLGATSAKGYEESPYFGAIVGRYANRIARGKFTLDGVEYTLATNNDENHLHGGDVGYDKVVWKAESFTEHDRVGVKFSYLSEDGEEGYPGNLSCTVIYELTNKDELVVRYVAETDKASPVNLTQHNYYNLSGHGNGTILDHELTIAADRYTPVDSGGIPTGELPPVAGTPMDFRTAERIGDRIDQVTGGYDHNYALNGGEAALAFAAKVYDPASGRVMEIYTTEPGIQFYTGNFLDGTSRWWR